MPEPGADPSLPCRLLHVDMDCFYAAVMLREHPELVDRPVLVGGADRGVVLSANYPARAAGVRSGVPTRQALRTCPDAVVLAPDFAAFTEVSRAVLRIFEEFTPRVQVLSLDEAYLDVAGAVRLLGPPAHIAELVRARVWSEQGIRCSVGVAATPTVAKMATNRAKPDGVCVVPPDAAVAFLRSHRVEQVYGVGPRTAAVLHRLELHTVADVAAVDPGVLEAALGRHAGRWLWSLAHGRDHRGMEPGRSQLRAERSMSNESTFGADTADPDDLRRHLLRLSTKLAARLRAADLAARTVGLRVRYSDFETLDRSRAVGEPTDVSREIFETTRDLLGALSAPGQPGHGDRPVRLLGVKVSGLVPRSRWQPQLVLGARTEGWADLDRAVDQASARFGRAVVRPATLVSGADHHDPRTEEAGPTSNAPAGGSPSSARGLREPISTGRLPPLRGPA